VSLIDKILSFFGLKIVRPMKHESKMTNEELLYFYEWAIDIHFSSLAKDFQKELEKRGLIKKE
jgi:hypothetical protein